MARRRGLIHRLLRAVARCPARREHTTVWAVGVVMVLVLQAAGLRAQVPQVGDSLLRPHWVVATTERFAGTHITSLLVDYELDQRHAGALIRANLASITTFFGSPTTRDQVDASVDVEYRMPTATRLFAIAETGISSDVRHDALIPGVNNTAFAFVGTGLRAVDSTGNRLGMAVGGAYNRQLNVKDAGIGLYGEAVGKFDLGGYDVAVDGRARWHNIAPRTNTNAYLDLRVDRRFDEGAFLTASGRYDLFSNDLYTKRSEDDVIRYGGLTYDGVQRRAESRMQVGVTLTYPIDEQLGIDVAMNVGNQRINQEELSDGLPPLPRDPEPYRYARNEFSIGSAASLRWAPPGLTSSLRLEYSTNEEANIVDAVRAVSDIELAQKRASNALNDYVVRQLMLGGSAEYRLAPTDTILLSGSIGIYRYDTPSPENHFDKDEQSIQAQVGYARRFSRLLDASIYGQVYLTHLVYLFGQNSNNNNWKRVFRIAQWVQYNLEGSLYNLLKAEVLANYTEYDFEGRTQNIRGLSFRELSLRDSIVVDVASRLRLGLNGVLQISERGNFSWRQFAESPLERIRTEGLTAELLSGALPHVWFGVGGRLSRVKTFRALQRGTVLEPFSDRTSFGPTASVQATLSASTDVRFWGWWEHRFEESRLVSRLPILFLTVGAKL